MDNNIHINGNWERGVSLNFEAFVNKTNKPELDDVTPHPSPEGEIVAGDAFYHYSVSDYDAYTIIVVIERLDDVVVQFVNRDSSYGKVGKRKIIPRQKLLEYRYDYLGRTILTKELEARLNYEHDLYLYNDAVQEAQYIQKYYGRTLKYKKPKNVSIPEVEYKPFPDIHIWV